MKSAPSPLRPEKECVRREAVWERGRVWSGKEIEYGVEREKSYAEKRRRRNWEFPSEVEEIEVVVFAAVVAVAVAISVTLAVVGGQGT